MLIFCPEQQYRQVMLFIAYSFIISSEYSITTLRFAAGFLYCQKRKQAGLYLPVSALDYRI
jgi:hypothetical protein